MFGVERLLHLSLYHRWKKNHKVFTEKNLGKDIRCSLIFQDHRHWNSINVPLLYLCRFHLPYGHFAFLCQFRNEVLLLSLLTASVAEYFPFSSKVHCFVCKQWCFFGYYWLYYKYEDIRTSFNKHKTIHQNIRLCFSFNRVFLDHQVRKEKTEMLVLW